MNTQRQAHGLLAVMLGTVMLLNTPGLGLAQRSPQTKTQVPTFDLAAVILPVKVFPLDDLYIVDGTFQTGEELDQYYPEGDDTREVLEESGFLGGSATNYRVEAPNGMGDETGAMAKVRVTIDEFEDADGAETWYEGNIDPVIDLDGISEREFPATGDQSILIESAPDTTPNSSFLFVMQQDAVTVRILISFFWGFSSEIDYLSTFDIETADLEPVVESLMDRLESARDREGGVVFFQTPRYIGTDNLTTAFLDERYLTLGGEEIFALDARLSQSEVSDEVDYYRRSASFADENDDRAWAEVSTIRFADAESAAAFVQEPKVLTSDHEKAGYTELEQVSNEEALPEADGELAVYQIVFVPDPEYSPDLKFEGFRYFVQVGDTILLLEFFAPDGIDPEVGKVLTEESLECLEGEAFCEPIPIPDDLAA